VSPPPSGRGVRATLRCSRAESLVGLAPVQRSAVTVRQFPAWGEDPAVSCRRAPPSCQRSHPNPPEPPRHIGPFQSPRNPSAPGP
jgi:hypothetical protein